MNLNNQIEHLFRNEYGKLVSILSAKFSGSYIDMIEDAVQDALYKAMQLWSYNEIPENPSGWLYRVARNNLIDRLRKERKSENFDSHFTEEHMEDDLDDSSLTSGIKDQQLKMIFACCHPALTETDQIMLSLKLLSGFGLKEIANALLKKEDTVKKAITRAKAKFKEKVRIIDVPNESEISERVKSVLNVIYLIFNEGYKSSAGDQLIKKDLCAEAIRLALLIDGNKSIDEPQVSALLALMYFNASRFDARIDKEGNLVLLENQDRSLWNQEFVKLGFYYLFRSGKGNKLSRLHLEAAIAGYYAGSRSFNEINWKDLLILHNLLVEHHYSPVTALNRLVVLEKVEGTKTALSEINHLNQKHDLDSNYLYHSIKARFLEALDQNENSLHHYQLSYKLCDNIVEKKFLDQKIKHSSQ